MQGREKKRESGEEKSRRRKGREKRLRRERGGSLGNLEEMWKSKKET